MKMDKVGEPQNENLAKRTGSKAKRRSKDMKSTTDAIFALRMQPLRRSERDVFCLCGSKERL